MGGRDGLVRETFIELADTLASGFDLGDFLHLLVDRCEEVLDVSTGGVLLESPDGTLRLAAATSEQMEELEHAEISHSEGPCFDAYRHGEQVVADDLLTAFGRWPKVAPLAVDMGLRAAHAFPLRLRDDRIGALNLYRDAPGAFPDDDIRLAQALADVAAIGILSERRIHAAEERAAQLQHALDSRVIIEQAKGVLAERAGISADDAFQRLRMHARRRGERISVVCRLVVETGFVPDPPT